MTDDEALRETIEARADILASALEEAAIALDAAYGHLAHMGTDDHVVLRDGRTLAEAIGTPSAVLEAGAVGLAQIEGRLAGLRAALVARTPEVADIEERLKLLRAASRPSEPLEGLAEVPATWRSDDHSATVRQPSAQGHILSAMKDLFDDLTQETLEWAGGLIAFDEAEIRAKSNEVIDLEGDGLLAVRYDAEQFSVSFVVFSFAGGPVTAGAAVVEGKKWERMFSGSGPAGTLRELRHTTWGEADAPGYLHCPSGKIISDAFRMLRRWFDC